jgi:hypothetical protein
MNGAFLFCFFLHSRSLEEKSKRLLKIREKESIYIEAEKSR